jgi:NADPH:quinone reductase-like Zn-dependent oxidoreductase
MMKAVVYTEYGPPEVLQLKEVEEPVPGDNEVLIKIHATTVTSEDNTFRKGDPFIARFVTGIIRPKKTILGTQLSGDIETVGKDVKRFRVGDQIFAASDAALSAHAEYICLQDDCAMVIKPANTSYAEAAALCGGELTALSFLRDSGNIRSGQKVLIYGASGSVGTAAVQLARYFGADVTGVCSSANSELVKSLGAGKVIDYTNEDFTRNGQAYDIIFDAVGKSSFSRCKSSLKQKGIYLTTVPSLGIILQMLWTSKVGSKKAKIAFTGLRPAGKKTEDLNFLRELIEADEIKPVIDSSYPLEQASDAHRYVEKGHKKGNVVIVMESGDPA